MLGLILIPLFVTVLKAQENHEVIYAQVGGTVTLPRDKIEQKDDNIKTQDIYVNWYRDSESSPTINRNPQSINKGKETNTHLSLSADFSLQVSPVQESDFVIWRCEQHVLAGNYKKTYKLYKVSIPSVPAVLVGRSLSLKCEKASSSVIPSVTWISPKKEGCQENKYYRDTVSVSNVSMCHNGVWTCQLDYEKKETVAKTTVFVIDLAPSPADPIYTSVSPSSTVSIPCSLSSAIPWSVLNKTALQGGSWSFTPLREPQLPSSLLTLNVGSVVQWDVADGAILAVEKRDITNHNLSIQNLPVLETIRGVYKCSLKFSTITISREVKVEVLKVSLSGGLKVFEGKGVNVTCSLGHMNTTGLQVKWKCNSNCPLNHKSPPHLSVLSFSNVRMQDKGPVKCELWKNGQKLTSAEIYLRVEKAPVDIWLWVAISSGVVVFILLVVITIICIRRHKQMMMYRRRKTRFCCCNNNKQPKGFYKT